MAYHHFDETVVDGSLDIVATANYMSQNLSSLSDMINMFVVPLRKLFVTYDFADPLEILSVAYVDYVSTADILLLECTYSPSTELVSSVEVKRKESGPTYDTIATRSFTYDGDGNCTGYSWT